MRRMCEPGHPHPCANSSIRAHARNRSFMFVCGPNHPCSRAGPAIRARVQNGRPFGRRYRASATNERLFVMIAEQGRASRVFGAETTPPSVQKDGVFAHERVAHPHAMPPRAPSHALAARAASYAKPSMLQYGTEANSDAKQISM